jgi:predicted thioesterase
VKSSPLNYITIITNITMEHSIHIYIGKQVAITHKVYQWTEKLKIKNNLPVAEMIMLAIYIRWYNKGSFI